MSEGKEKLLKLKQCLTLKGEILVCYQLGSNIACKKVGTSASRELNL